MSRFETFITSSLRMANRESRPKGYIDFSPYTMSRKNVSRSSVGTTFNVFPSAFATSLPFESEKDSGYFRRNDGAASRAFVVPFRNA